MNAFKPIKFNTGTNTPYQRHSCPWIMVFGRRFSSYMVVKNSACHSTIYPCTESGNTHKLKQLGALPAAALNSLNNCSANEPRFQALYRYRLFWRRDATFEFAGIARLRGWPFQQYPRSCAAAKPAEILDSQGHRRMVGRASGWWSADFGRYRPRVLISVAILRAARSAARLAVIPRRLPATLAD